MYEQRQPLVRLLSQSVEDLAVYNHTKSTQQAGACVCKLAIAMRDELRQLPLHAPSDMFDDGA